MKKKISKIGLFIISILFTLKNNLYAYSYMNDDSAEMYENIFFIVIFVVLDIIIIGYSFYIALQNDRKIMEEQENIKSNVNNENSLETENNVEVNNRKEDENKIRYLVATLILLSPIFFVIYTLITAGSVLIGLIVLGVLILYNCLGKYTYLERFYHNAKLVVPLILLFFLYV